MPLKTITAVELMAMPRKHPGFSHSGKHWTITWGGYDYDIEDSRISTPLELLGWVEHLASKAWRKMTPYRIAEFVRAVSEANGWDIYGI